MRAIALRTKTALTALTAAGALALGITAAFPSTGALPALEHVTAALTGHSHSGPVLADDRGPYVVGV